MPMISVPVNSILVINANAKSLGAIALSGNPTVGKAKSHSPSPSHPTFHGNRHISQWRYERRHQKEVKQSLRVIAEPEEYGVQRKSVRFMRGDY
jgi:hypothetical protein